MPQAKVPRIDGLSNKRRLFVTEYLIDCSPTDAAIRAGFNPVNAQSVGKALMNVPAVKASISRALAARSVRVGINAERVLRELGAMAFGDARAALNPDGSLKAPHEMSDDDAKMVAGIKTRRIVEIGDDGKMRQAEIQEVRFADKVRVLELVMKHLGMAKDVTVHEVGESLAKQLEAAHARTVGHVIDLTAEEDEFAMRLLEAEERGEALDIDREEAEKEEDWSHLV